MSRVEIFAYDNTCKLTAPPPWTSWFFEAKDFFEKKIDKNYERKDYADPTELLTVSLRRACMQLGAIGVTFRDIGSFVAGVKRSTPKGHTIKRLIVLDHGFGLTGTDYVSQKHGTKHFQVGLEIGNQRINNGTFQQYEKDLATLRPLFDKHSRCVFLNCLVGNDPALLHKFATVWGIPVSGCTEDQSAVESFNISRGNWVTVDSNKNMRVSKQHPLM